MNLRTKSFEFFNGLFDFGAGQIRNGFYPIAQGGQSSPPVNIIRSETGDVITPQRSLELAAVWACTWLIADTIATLPFVLRRRKSVGGYGIDDIDNPLYTVLSLRPNLAMDAIVFWQYLFASKLLWGNGYATKDTSAGQTILLEPLLSQFMVPYRPQVNSQVIRYKYFPGGLTNDPIEDYSADEIFHLKDRTLDGLVGLSRVQYARQSYGIARATDKATAEVYKNGMRTNGFLMYDKILKPEQRTQIKGALASMKSGGQDSNAFMILEAGMSFESLSMPPQDVQLIESRKFSVEDICRWFGVPPVLIGDQGVSTWGSGIEQLLEGFKALTLRPHIRGLEMAVANQLVATKDRAMVYLRIDTDDLQAMDIVAKATMLSTFTQNGILTRNEARAKIDSPPSDEDNADSLTVQSNLVPIEKLGEMGGSPTGAGFGLPAPKPPAATPPSPPPPAKKAA
jgi:HK97 family phage portal protein